MPRRLALTVKNAGSNTPSGRGSARIQPAEIRRGQPPALHYAAGFGRWSGCPRQATVRSAKCESCRPTDDRALLQAGRNERRRLIDPMAGERFTGCGRDRHRFDCCIAIHCAAADGGMPTDYIGRGCIGLSKQRQIRSGAGAKATAARKIAIPHCACVPGTASQLNRASGVRVSSLPGRSKRNRKLSAFGAEKIKPSRPTCQP